jgi:hypothetical protein
MLARRAIEAGKCYVNEERQRTREVLKVDHQTIHFCTYDLETGKLHGSPGRQCTRDEIIRWADREATAVETASLHREEYEALFHVGGRALTKSSPDIDAWTATLNEQARRTISMK